MLKIAICDDNQLDLLQLKTMVCEIMEKYSIQCTVLEYDSGEKLLESPLDFRLIFLNSLMKEADGIEIGKKIYHKKRFIKIVFQVNSQQDCREAVNKAHAFAFLEKPVQSVMMEEVIREFLESGDGAQEIHLEFKNIRCLSKERNTEKAVLRIPVKNIVYFEYLKLQKEVKIVTDEGVYVYAEAMNRLEERMQPLGFETCCRGIMVNMGRIWKIKGYRVWLNNGESIPLSQRRVAYLKERVTEYVHT